VLLELFGVFYFSMISGSLVSMLGSMDASNADV
jgi:hypothetical protein